MPFIRGELVEEVCEAIRGDQSVALVGDRGSGRSTLLREVARQLELTGVEVVNLSGHPLLADERMGALRRSLDIPNALIEAGSGAVVDHVAAGLHQNSRSAFIIDDIDLVDEESLAIVDLVSERLEIPVAFSYRRQNLATSRLRVLLGKWGPRCVSVEPLRYEQVVEVVETYLRGQAERELVSAVFTEAAGNLRLLFAILRTAKDKGFVQKKNDLWTLTSRSLWHSDLNVVAESFLSELSEEQRRTLFSIALLSPRRLSDVAKSVDLALVEDLESRGLLSAIGVEDPMISLTPPLLLEYVRYGILPARRITALSSLSGAGEPSSALYATISDDSPDWADTHEDVALARLFDEHAGVRADALWLMWKANPSPQQGLAFIEAVWDSANPHPETETVLAYLDSAAFEDRWQGLQVASMKAEWELYRNGDPDRARGILSEFGSSNVSMEQEALAYSLFIDTVTGAVPSDFAAQLRPEGTEAEGSIVAVVLAFLHVVTLSPEEALAALSLMPEAEPALLAGLADMVHALALHQLRRHSEANTLSLESLRKARNRLDKPGVLAIGYGACFALYQTGRWYEAEQLMGSVFAAGKPGMVTAPIYAALTRISAFVAVRTGRSQTALMLARTADHIDAETSSLPGMSTHISQAVEALAYGKTEEASELLEQGSAEQHERGYRFAALALARMALSVNPAATTLGLLQAILGATVAAGDAVLVRIASAIVNQQGQTLLRLIEELSESGDEPYIAAVIDSALAQPARDLEFRGQLAKARDFLTEKYPVARQREGLTPKDSVVVLTERERQVALLVKTLNNQEIADRLSLSVRTVENHIYSAMRKTGAQTRAELFAYASESLLV